MTEAEGKAATLLALRDFAVVWCLRSLADVSLPFYRWAWAVEGIGLVPRNGKVTLVAAMSLLATTLLVRARPARSIRVALLVAATLLVLRVVPLFVYVAVDATGAAIPDWMQTLVRHTSVLTGRLVEIVPLAGALAIARTTSLALPRWTLAVPLSVVVLDAIALTDFRNVFYGELAMGTITSLSVDTAFDGARWALPLGVGLSLLGHARSAVGDQGEEEERRAQLALRSWILAVLTGYASLAPHLVENPARPPWWLPSQVSMVLVSDLLACAFALLLAARACAWAAGLSAFAAFFGGRAFYLSWLIWSSTSGSPETWASLMRTWSRTTGVLAAIMVALVAVAIHRMARSAKRPILARIAAASGVLLLARVVTYLAGDPLDSSALLYKVSLGAQLAAQTILAGVAYALLRRDDDHVNAEVFTTTMDGEVD